MYLLPSKEDSLGLQVLADKGLLPRQALEGKKYNVLNYLASFLVI